MVTDLLMSVTFSNSEVNNELYIRPGARTLRNTTKKDKNGVFGSGSLHAYAVGHVISEPWYFVHCGRFIGTNSGLLTDSFNWWLSTSWSIAEVLEVGSVEDVFRSDPRI
ncbi:hypothetical protein CHU98_g4482 [Xylaria longipes]|nr:hypothetical protein CHU98_g4482 [Xylaria longipes]